MWNHTSEASSKKKLYKQGHTKMKEPTRQTENKQKTSRIEKNK